MSRISLKSSNTAVIIGDSPAFKTYDETGYIFASVKSASFGFSFEREDLRQIGSESAELESINRMPNVELNLSYGFSPTFANEELLGINYELDVKPKNSIFSGLDDKSYNFYFYNHPEMGEDGLDYIKDINFTNGGEVISIGNAYLKSYSLRASVGSLPEVQVAFDCSNVEVQKYDGPLKSPAINLKSGNASGVGGLDIVNTKYLEDRKFGDIYDLDRSNVEVALPYDILFDLQEIEIGGQKISFEEHRLTSFDLNMPIDRVSTYRLGSNYVCGRELKSPIKGTLSFSSLVSELEAGFISGIINEEPVSNLIVRTFDCRKQITSQFFIDNLRVSNIEYSMLVNGSMTYSLSFTFDVDSKNGFKTLVTEQDIGATRFIDQNNSVKFYELEDIPAGWVAGDLDGVKLLFGNAEDLDVGASAFEGCSNISSGELYIPYNVTTIGDNAFKDCSGIPGMYFDDRSQLTSLGASSFENCVGLNEINIPKSVNTLGNRAFYECDGAEELYLNQVSNIGDFAFYGCGGLKGTLEIPDATISLGQSAFENCSGFNGGLYIGESLDYIPQKAFKNATNLSFDLVIPNNVSGIGDEAFYQCRGFNGELTLSNQLSTINPFVFFSCSSLTGSLVLPDSVETVKDSAFKDCSGFDGFFSPGSGLKYIENNAFENCVSLTENIAFPSGILDIGDQSFKGCESLLGPLIIPSGINSIGDAAFSGCTSIVDVYVDSPPTIFLGNNAFEGASGCLYVTPFHYNDYKLAATDGIFQGLPICLGSDDTIVYNATNNQVIKSLQGDIPSGWYSNETTPSLLIIGTTCERIEDWAFTDSVGLQGLLFFHEDVQYIGLNAFRNTNFDGELILPSTITEVKSGAFENCSGFNDFLDLGENLTGIENNTFKNCTGLIGELYLSDSMTYIGDSAFENCQSLDGELLLSANVLTIGDYAFYNCKNLQGEIEVPSDIQYIGDFAFSGCSGFDSQLDLENITELTYIGDSAFEGCSNLAGDLYLNPPITYLGAAAFKDCSLLGPDLFFNASVSGIEEDTFRNCSTLSGPLQIPDFVEYIGDNAFNGCVGFTDSITITDVAAQNIGQDAFLGCAFDELIVSDAVEEISIGEFDYFKTLPLALTINNTSGILNDSFAGYNIVGALTISNAVIYIGDRAFSGLNQASGFYDWAGGNIEWIGKGAFYDCSKMQGGLEFPLTLQYIDDYAFYNNTGVNGEIKFEDALLSGIGDYSFFNVENAYGSLTIPNSISGANLGQYAFAQCSGLDGILTLSNQLTLIDEGAFKDCQNLTGDLVIPDSVLTIENFAFTNCYGFVRDLTITDYAASSLLGKNSFDQSNFDRLIVSDIVTHIDNTEFDYFSSRSLELVLQSGLSGINDYAFDNYSFVGELTFPDSLTGIGVNAFYDCNGFSGSLIIPQNVTKIDTNAFYSCGGFSGYLEIPDLVGVLGDGAFVDCVGFDDYLKISDYTASIVTSYSNVFANTNFTELKVSSTDGTVSEGEMDSFNAFLGDLTLLESVDVAGSTSFDGFGFLGSLNMVGPPYLIDSYAFSGDTFVGDLRLSSQDIGEGAFYQCTFDGNLVFEFDSTINVGDYAFYECQSFIGDLTINPSMETIGDYAFYDLTSLAGEFFLVDLDGFVGDTSGLNTNLASIGEYAFAESNLSGNLVTADSIKSIGQYAFLNNSSLNGFLVLGSGITKIATGTFKNCSSLQCYGPVFEIPETVTLVEDEAFYNCVGLTCSLKIRNTTARVLGIDAFFNHNFSSLTIPHYVNTVSNLDYDYFKDDQLGLIFENEGGEETQNIGSYAFDGYSFNGTLSLPATLQSLGEFAFYDNDGFNGDLEIPDEIYDIESHVFANCSGFDGNLIYGDVIDNIGPGAFKNCTNVGGEISLPVTLDTIGSGAFMNCSNLSGIIAIPNAITSVGAYAFSGCTNISGAVIDTTPVSVFAGGQGQFSGVGGVLKLSPLVYNDYEADSVLQGGKYYFRGIEISGVGDPDTYFYTGVDSNINNRVLDPPAITTTNNQPYAIPSQWRDATLDSSQNEYCWLEIGSVVTAIGQKAFYDRRQLRDSVTIPGSVNTVEGSGFYNCYNLESLILSDGLVRIEDHGFYYNQGMTSVLNFPNSLEYIGKYAFYNSINLGAVTFGQNLSGIDDYAFYESKLGNSSIQFNNGLETIGNNAFERADMSSIIFSDSILSIGDNAFQNTTTINSSIDLPASLTYLGAYAFNGSHINGEISFPNGITDIKNNTFQDSEIETINSFNNVTTIGERAFSQCGKLRGNDQNIIAIPNTITSLGQFAFANVGNSIQHPELVSVYDGFNKDNHSGYVFANMSYLQSGDITGAKYLNTGIFSACARMHINSGTFGSGLSGIEERAFEGIATVRETPTTRYSYINIPSGVEYIGNYAFSNVFLAKTVNFESGSQIKHLPDYCFQRIGDWYGYNENRYGESGLEYISLPSGLETIGESCFQNAYAPTIDFNLPDTVSGVGKNFLYGSKWSGIYLNDEIKTLPTGALQLATGYKVYIPESINKFEPNSFIDFVIEADGINDRKLTFGSGLNEIQYSSFQNSSFTGLDFSKYVGDGVFFNGHNVFYGSDLSGTINMPKAYWSAAYQMFRECLDLENVVFKNSIYSNELPFSCFYGCTSLTGVTLDSGINKLRYDSFRGCSSLTEIDIRNTVVDEIEYRAFYDCSSLADVYLCNGYITTLGNNVFQNCTSLNNLEICSTIVNFGNGVFQGAIINQLDLESNITIIPDDFFNGATIGTLNLPTTVVEVGQRSFKGAVVGPDPFTSFTNLVTGFGNNAFENTNLSGLQVPTGLRILKTGIFKNSVNFTGADFSNCTLMDEIQDNNFENCDNLTTVIFPNVLTGISDANFTGCASLTGLDLSNTAITDIGNNNFFACPSMSGIELPSTLINIGNSNFETTDLDGFTIPPNLETIGNRNFFDCDGSSWGDTNNPLDIHSNILSIGDSNWENADCIQFVEIGVGFSGTIGDRNWYDGNQIVEVRVKTTDANASIGSQNFASCNSLTDIYIDCESGFWVGTNNFQSINTTAVFRIKNANLSQYNNGTWSGAQGLPNGVQIVGY